MKTPLLFISIMLSGAIHTFAQPIISNVIMPVHGYVMNLHKTPYVSPGPGGANQTWNFSSLVSQSVQSFTAGPSSVTPYASSFPGTTMQMNDGTNYEFWSVTSNDASCVGIVDSSGVQPNNPDTIFKFPLQYNDFHYGGALGVFSWGIPAVLMNRVITSSLEYDGYGTLTTPSGSFSNVARFRIYRDVTTSANHHGVHFQSDEYRWYSNLFHCPLLTVYSYTVTFQGGGGFDYTLAGCKYQQVDPANFVALSDYKPDAPSVYAYPNPVSTMLFIDAVKEGIRKVEVVDTRGLLVKEISVNNQERVEINIEDLDVGIYFVKMFSEDRTTKCYKIFVKHE